MLHFILKVIKLSFSFLEKFIKAIFQFLYRYGKFFIEKIILSIQEFGKKIHENFLYDLVKYGLILFLVTLYVNRGFIIDTFLGEQSIYCQLCYHLEMEQEFFKIEIRNHFTTLANLMHQGTKKEKERGTLKYFTLLQDINSSSPKVFSLRSKIYDSLKKHNEISLAMKYSYCDRISKLYSKNRVYSRPHYRSIPVHNIKSLCKFRKMSFFDKIIYHIKNMIYKISMITEI